MEVLPQDPMTIEEGDEEGEDGDEGGEAKEHKEGETEDDDLKRESSQQDGVGIEEGTEAVVPTVAVESVSIDAMANGAHGTSCAPLLVLGMSNRRCENHVFCCVASRALCILPTLCASL